MLPSAAYVPLRMSVSSTAKPPVLVQAPKVPDSKPSAKTGTGAAGVVAETVGVNADRLPDVSRARTAYVWVEPAVTDESL